MMAKVRRFRKDRSFSDEENEDLFLVDHMRLTGVTRFKKLSGTRDWFTSLVNRCDYHRSWLIFVKGTK